MAKVRVGAAEIDLRLNTGHFEKGAQKVKRQNVLMRKAFVALGGVLTVHAIKRMFEWGAAVEETGSKFRAVFGEMESDVQSFVDSFANMAGLTRREAQDILATTGAMAQGMGLAREQSAQFAEEVTRLAGDLASFNNIPITETAQAINAAVTGEREQLKRLGIVIREVDVQQRALLNTGRESVRQITDQEKATATLQLITERAGVAVGDLTRTQDSAANTARRLSAKFRDIRDALAQALLPVFDEWVTVIEDALGGTATFADWLIQSQPVFVAWSRVVAEAFLAIGRTLHVVMGSIIETIKDIYALFSLYGQLKTGNFTKAWEDASQIMVNRARWLRDEWGTVFGDVEELFATVETAMASTADTTIRFVRPAFRTVESAAGMAADEVERLNTAMSKFNAISNAVGFLSRVLPFLSFLQGPLGIVTGGVSAFSGLQSAFSGGGTGGSSGTWTDFGTDAGGDVGAVGGVTLNLRISDFSGRTTRVLRGRIADLDNLDVPVVV